MKARGSPIHAPAAGTSRTRKARVLVPTGQGVFAGSEAGEETEAGPVADGGALEEMGLWIAPGLGYHRGRDE